MDCIVKKFFGSFWFPCLVFISLGMIVAAIFRFEIMWDFYNYHYYNAFALLHNRIEVDVTPAFVNTFFNPAIELPAYFLTNWLNHYPVLFSAIMGIPYGLLLFVVFKIAGLFFDIKTGWGRLAVLFAVLLAGTGHAVFSQVSSTTHEITLGVFVLTALYILLNDILNERTGRFLIYAGAGLLLGAAFGLKLNFGLYALATGLTLIVLWKRLPSPKVLISFVAGGVLGFCLAHGYWSWILWQNFHNPVFPFLNFLFDNPDFEKTAKLPFVREEIDWFKRLIFPFILTLNNRLIHFAELPITVEPRYLLGYVLFCVWGIYALIRRQKTPLGMAFVVVWLLLSYVIWLFVFMVPRYLVPIEVMLAIPLTKIIFMGQKAKNFIACGLFYFSLIFFAYFFVVSLLFSDFYEQRWAGYPILDVQKVKFNEKAVVILSSGVTSFVLPLLAQDNPDLKAVVSSTVDSINYSDIHQEKFFADKRDKILKEHEGVNFFVTTDVPDVLRNSFWHSPKKKGSLFKEKISCKDVAPLFNGIFILQICATDKDWRKIEILPEKY